MRAALAFFLGVLLVHGLPVPPGPWLLPCLPLSLAAASRWPALASVAWFVAGALWTAMAAQRFLAQAPPPALDGEHAVVEGRVRGLPEAGDGRLRFELDVDRLRSARREWPVHPRLRIDWYGAPALAPAPGERWRLTVRLRRARGLANPGGGDFEAWLVGRRIHATGVVLPASSNARLSLPARADLDRIRGTLVARMHAAIGAHPRAGIVVALATGDASAIGDRDWELLRRTGTTHLVSISGLHVGLAAAFAFVLLRFAWSRAAGLALRVPSPRIAAVGAMVAAAGYAALAGWAVPTQRALVLTLVAMAGLVLARPVPAGPLFGAALLAVLVVDPFAPLAIGFWLSFAAAGLIVFAGAGRAPRGPRWRRALAVQGAIAIGLAPLLLVFFGQNPLLGPLANLIAVPWVSFAVVPAVLLGAGLVVLAPAAGVGPLALAAVLLDWLWVPLGWLAQQPAAVWNHGATGPLVAIPALAGVAFLLLPRGLPGRWCGIVWLLPLAFPVLERPAHGTFMLTVLDVGQGLSAVVETRWHALLFDAGPRHPGGFDAGARVVLPYLRRRALRALDAAIVSHGDLDHAGGWPAVGAAMPVAALLSSAPLAGSAPCARGHRWRWDGVEFEILHPAAGSGGRDNDRSCVLRVAGAGGSALLTGDVEASAERDLVARGLAPADVLVAPHHGSRTSSSAAFVAAVAPRHVLIPAGWRNRFGFPHPEVLARYRARGSEPVVVGVAGATRVELDGRGRPPDGWRAHSRRWWRAR